MTRSPVSQRMHEVQVFCYLGAGMLAFIFSWIFIKCISCFCYRIRRQRQPAAASPGGGSGYREVVVETPPPSRVAEASGEEEEEWDEEYDFEGKNNNSSSSSSDEKIKERFNLCAICICEMGDGDVCWELTACNHKFHAECIRKWMKKNKSCPLCRTVIIIQTL